MIRSVRRIGRDVSIERPLGRGFAFDPLRRLSEELIGAIARSLHELAVMQDGRAVIGISRDVAAASRITLANATGAMDEDFVEAALVRLILGFVAEVPLAKDASAITGLLQLLGQCGRAQGHSFALQDGVRDAILEFMPSGQQRAARRGAGRRDLEIGETDALAAESVQIRGPEDRVAMGAHVAVSLVVRQDEKDVGPIGRQRRQGAKQNSGEESHGGVPAWPRPRP